MATLTMGLIGEITADASPEFLYDFITPDFSRQPKRPNNPFDGEGNWPSSIAIFQQRRVYASTDGKPSTLFFSHIGFFDDFSLTEFPDGSFELELDSKYFDRISHMVPMHVGLLLFSERDVYLVTSAGSSGITLNTAVSRNELESGARRDVQPINVLKNVVFMSNLDGSPRALAPTPQSDSQLITQDLALLNQHLFDKSDVIAWTYAGRNDRIIWAVRADGVLLSCTYAPEHQVSAWCKHSTRGRFLDVQAVYEERSDTVYMIVERGQHSFIEYFPGVGTCSELGTAVDASVEAPKTIVRRNLEIADYVDGNKQGAPDTGETDTFFADYTGIGAQVEDFAFSIFDVGSFICTRGGVYEITEVKGVTTAPPVEDPEDPMTDDPADDLPPVAMNFCVQGINNQRSSPGDDFIIFVIVLTDDDPETPANYSAPEGGVIVPFTPGNYRRGITRVNPAGWIDFTENGAYFNIPEGSNTGTVRVEANFDAWTVRSFNGTFTINSGENCSGTRNHIVNFIRA